MLGKQKVGGYSHNGLVKAFNSLDQSIIVDKLGIFSVTSSSYSWIKLYLSNHYQCTKINGVCFAKILLKCGVHQGSILGPLLPSDVYL